MTASSGTPPHQLVDQVVSLTPKQEAGSTVQTARVSIDADRTVGVINRRIFGGFVEHMGRGVYGGIYDPAHASSDEEGFRSDVLELVRELGISTFRYPGGNFVSGYKWEDSVGPREHRPTRLNLAWHSTETNEFGLHEFASWLDKVGGELMLAVNLGTRGTQEAIELLEYVNLPRGTTLSNQRGSNGRAEPLGVRMWCLGNEMDGPWQLGQQSAEDYGKLAAQTAKAMRQLDPDLELVACGSSSASMPTFGEWEKSVLSHTYDDVDFISCHAYYEPIDGDIGSFLASPVDMDRFIDSVVATADHVKAARGSSKTINVSFDEWNVWYASRLPESLPTYIADWPLAPPLSEDDYTVTDAVVVGGLLMSLVRHADRVTSASLAQVVNVIAPIGASESGQAWRKATFFPFSLTSRYARGMSLDVVVESATYETPSYGEVPLIDCSATYDAENGEGAVFLVNRSQTDSCLTGVHTSQSFHGLELIEVQTLSDSDHSAANTESMPDRVGMRPNPSARATDAGFEVELPPVSWTVLRFGTTSGRSAR